MAFVCLFFALITTQIGHTNAAWVSRKDSAKPILAKQMEANNGAHANIAKGKTSRKGNRSAPASVYITLEMPFEEFSEKEQKLIESYIIKKIGPPFQSIASPLPRRILNIKSNRSTLAPVGDSGSTTLVEIVFSDAEDSPLPALRADFLSSKEIEDLARHMKLPVSSVTSREKYAAIEEEMSSRSSGVMVGSAVGYEVLLFSVATIVVFAAIGILGYSVLMCCCYKSRAPLVDGNQKSYFNKHFLDDIDECDDEQMSDDDELSPPSPFGSISVPTPASLPPRK
mmetsp:Transcript_29694/g.52127  ORF Transcript_29694/g.52127 Transcript_29694/m.52127 type:complete len:283 (-) Transcript_29694:512-1360(-)|eukprot:CAMPEP_0197526916 /NCGR_PEP_ID=MMETSP1318-20131121/19713_1 /TAXON_ID=552666 /ORGANISM="Partenskyella glossopodia, Strain RCC365" /LENGTH=282 /DNA_ID=CAMNT_0043081305 /DNA_START=67 /DNA_END=915 /DNA_ORIENTATION=-